MSEHTEKTVDATTVEKKTIVVDGAKRKNIIMTSVGVAAGVALGIAGTLGFQAWRTGANMDGGSR